MSAHQPVPPPLRPTVSRHAKLLLLVGAGVACVVVSAVVYAVFNDGHKPAPPARTTQDQRPSQSPAESAAKKAAADAASDNRQRASASAVVVMLQSYASDNTGAYPTSTAALQTAIDNYGKLVPGGTLVVYKQSYGAAEVPKIGTVFYYPGYTCGMDVPEVASSQRSIAVSYVLSGGRLGCTDIT